MSEAALESLCHVWDEDLQIPGDESFPCATFIINIQATLTTASSYEEEEEDDGDEPCFIEEPETESVVRQKIHSVRAEDLMNNNIHSVLVSMKIPVQDSMVEKILTFAHRMRVNKRYTNRKVLRMNVKIDAVVDELPEDEDEDDEEDEDSDSMAIDNVTVIGKMRKVVIDGSHSCCPICLEDFLVGTEASSMPVCSHVFHSRCIVPWLSKKKPCPLCRSELN